MKLIEEVKSHSSKWIKTKGGQYQKFYWQNGYGGFSVAPSQVDVVKDYIVAQEKHHGAKSFNPDYALEYKNGGPVLLIWANIPSIQGLLLTGKAIFNTFWLAWFTVQAPNAKQ